MTTPRVRDLANVPLQPLLLASLAMLGLQYAESRGPVWNMKRPHVDWSNVESVVHYTAWMIHESTNIWLLRETTTAIETCIANPAFEPHLPMLVSAYFIRSNGLAADYPIWAAEVASLQARILPPAEVKRR